MVDDAGGVGDRYLLDNRAATARARLDVLGEIFDPWTHRHLESVGLRRGWRCWEVGAGGPAMVVWLAEAVGTAGFVLATDLEPGALEAVEGPGPPGADRAAVAVLRHDVGRDRPPPAPGDGFDLVHARLVLGHVPAREAALATMVGATASGGWVVVEEADPALQPLACPEARTPEEERANRIRLGFRSLLAGRGVDLAYGRSLPRRLRELGLEKVGADAWFPVVHPAMARLEILTVATIRDRLLAEGITSEDELDAHLHAVERGRVEVVQPPLVSAWGRRP